MRARGFSLLELLLSISLGLVLVATFLASVHRSRLSFTGSESQARLHEAARHALSVLVDDIEHAGFYGGADPRRRELLRRGAVVAVTPELGQGTPDVEINAVSGLPAGAHDCGANFAVDLSRIVQSTDNRYGLTCAPTASAGGVRPMTDTLTLRRASAVTSDPRAGRLQIWSAAVGSAVPLKIFADGQAPADGAGEVRDLEVRSYYVANDSVGRPGVPALRVKALTESRGEAQFRDEELMPGVEDLQVQIGVRTADDGRARVIFVDPDTEAARLGSVIAVRLWLRVRSEVYEPGPLDDRPLTYSNVSFTPGPADSGWRRLLVSRTVALRNVHE